ncbi:LacI family DNA-binding transcriptional regulator [Salipiger mangrovisoli]|uniref:LacI family DNA-binding transcriptional regulator n=1 Tax=Salipiger mangrovisoli TaxID=2865933 RepID=A0ABR9X5Q0_9RHOB|nr:LacI family DNA-binding transcriptional regulator [Salipiger mangrovisoli]MBE9638836.1 LacI family DNA-binding transcriptional regulator [Salipiger mangrovisoli]
MNEKVTSLQVAERAGVSQSAVSRYFTPGASVSKATAAKVQKAAEELGYRPNVLARAMVSGRSRIIGLIIADLKNQFYPLALELLGRELQERDYQVLVFFAANSTEGIEPVVQKLLDYQVDGIITASVAMSNSLTERCAAAGIPVVMFNRGQDDPRLSSVTTDNVAGGRMAANFLVAGGHERIAHIAGWQGATTGRDRTLGFLDGLRDLGREVFAMEDGMYQREHAAEVARAMFSGAERPDSVFVGNDYMATAVMDVLRFELGLSIPEDVSVLGYDDVPLAAWPTYQLTTIRQPVTRMVTATVDTLLDRIEGNPEPKQIKITGALKIRASARKPKGFTS